MNKNVNSHHGAGDEKQAKSEKESSTRIMFLVERLRASTASTSASTAAETESNQRHQEGSDDGDDRDDDDQPILLQQIVILMFLNVWAPIDFHILHNEVAWNT